MGEMREILFRGKRKDNGKWVEGYYARKGVDRDTFKHFICVMTFNVNGNTYSSMFYLTDIEVIPETVGQYTGLTDKNGTRIFEGDIVVVYDAYCNETVVGIVCFGDGSFYIRDTDCSSYDRWMYYESEAIGNIYDNPELLKNN